jgi:UDP-N-acetylmuramoyl-L-alanine---L-glutamate ligase
MKLEKLKNKKILILGWGREGKDALSFFHKNFPKKIIGIADQKDFFLSARQLPKVEIYSGKNYLEVAKDYDLLVKSPGIPYKILPKFLLKKITTPTEIFLDNYPGKVIGVTGTKGKSTTASMIYRILKENCKEKRVFLGGNIGKPVLSFLEKAKKEDIFVYELSSHQLYNLKKSFFVAVLLNIYPEHLDYYKDFKDYISAKANITLWQNKNNFLIYNSDNKLVKKIADKSLAQKIEIKGEYYQLDKMAAQKVGEIFGISHKKIEKTINNFKGLPHRLELVGTFKGITFYNDALATIPQATISAIDALKEKVETIILGGFDRNINFKDLANRILKSKIKTIILFPSTGQKIKNSIVRQNNLRKERKKLNYFFINQNNLPGYKSNQYMKEPIEKSKENTSKGKICLLSTACPSFSIFKDYKEKGDLFKKYAKKVNYGQKKK